MVSEKERIMSPEEYVNEVDFNTTYFTGAFAAAKEHGFSVPSDPEAAEQELIDKSVADIEVTAGGAK